MTENNEKLFDDINLDMKSPNENQNPLCGCGCGQRVNKPYNKYLMGHQTKKKVVVKIPEVVVPVVIPEIVASNTNHLCECGCGQIVTKSTNRFIQGHALKKRNRSELVKAGIAAKIENTPIDLLQPEDPDDLSFWFNEDLFFRDKAGNLKSKNTMSLVKTKQEIQEIEDKYYGEVTSNAEALKRSLEAQFGKRGELLAKELKKMITDGKTVANAKLAAIKLAAEYFTGGLGGTMTIKVEKKVANFYKMISE